MATIRDLSTLPADGVVFVDTNIFDLHFKGKSVSCTALLWRIASGDVTAYVNTQVLSDLLHKLMLNEAFVKKLIAKPRAVELRDALSKDRTIAAALTDYQAHFEHTLGIGLKVLKVSRGLLVATKLERVTYGLMTGDSIHLGNMNRHSVILRDIASNDGDFAHIPNLTVWKPMDIV